VRGGEVDIWIILVVETAAFAVGVVGSGEFFEITCTPSINSNDKDCEYECKEDDNTAEVSAISLLD
jgi:hypothetical protein